MRKALGKRGEDAALKFLESMGMVLIDRNIHSRTGEIDLIVRDGETLVFCEVKTRRGVGAAPAVESYTATQIGRLRKQIQVYLMKNPWDGPLRVDVVALQKALGSQAYRVEHLIDAVDFDGMG